MGRLCVFMDRKDCIGSWTYYMADYNSAAAFRSEVGLLYAAPEN